MSLLAKLVIAGQAGQVVQVPSEKFSRRNWFRQLAPLGLETFKNVEKFCLDGKAGEVLAKFVDTISEDELTKLVKKTRLPFENMWMEFDIPISSDGKTGRAGILSCPDRDGSGVQILKCFFVSNLNGRETAAYILIDMTFKPDCLPEVPDGQAFVRGLCPQRISELCVDRRLVSPEALDPVLRKEFALGATNKDGIIYKVVQGNFLPIHFFVFCWLLSQRIIRFGRSTSVSVREKSASRGWKYRQIETREVEIDLLRVKEIRDRPAPAAPTGITRSEHAVMGHWCENKHGKKFWRRPHRRGTGKSGPARAGYSVGVKPQ